MAPLDEVSGVRYTPPGALRASTCQVENKKAMARKDLETILAENAGYEGTQERLRELA